MLQRLVAALALFALFAAAPQAAAAQQTLTVFAAASMKNALDDVNAAFTKATGVKVTASYAASSALAKQIEQGAPADVFVSADLELDGLPGAAQAHQAGHARQSARQQAGADRAEGFQARHVEIGQGFDIAKLAGDGRIAVADVAAVPAGNYAKAALEKLGAWAAAEPKLAQAENVRAALALVARGEAPLGIVYETDAKVEPKVKIVGVFPDSSLSADHLSGGADRRRQAGGGALSAFLRSTAAKAIFERYGFSVLAKPVS